MDDINITEETAELLKWFNAGTFICNMCGRIIYPKVTIDRYGISVVDERAEIRGGLGNHILKKNVCNECIHKMQIMKD